MQLFYVACLVPNISGARLGLQPAHDPVRHSEDEGVQRWPRDAHGPDVPDCQRLPDLPRPEAHLVGKHGNQAQGAEAPCRGRHVQDPLCSPGVRVPAHAGGQEVHAQRCRHLLQTHPKRSWWVSGLGWYCFPRRRGEWQPVIQWTQCWSFCRGFATGRTSLRMAW